MSNLDCLKNRLIDRILLTKNKELLQAIEKILISTKEKDLISFSSEQIEMLTMGEKDIKSKNYVSESDLDKIDNQWID